MDKKKIVSSLVTISAAGALLIGATFAFFSDNETSQDNVFTAGELDLQIDSTATYNGQPVEDSTWVMKNLNPQADKFFNFDDIKPGDFGENTISLHVFDNDAWGRLIIADVQDLENGCGGSEAEVENCNTGNDGELREALQFHIWLDEGSQPGFQGASDEEEGDNVQQGGEPTLVSQGTIDSGGETHNILEGLAAAYLLNGCTTVDGNAGGDCPGLAQDGRLVGSITYYFGIDWELPNTVSNEVQTDSLSADMIFEVVQHRNNPGQTF